MLYYHYSTNREALSMPKSDNQKLKIFYILDYLQKNSHEDHPVRAGELISMLEHQHNILCERKTIYSDIAALQEYGMDIVSIPGKNGGYFLIYRLSPEPPITPRSLRDFSLSRFA
jgi:predicted DNA-binding transcriptional regulator YafY